ncbi:MAG: hypothetical protein ACRDPC_04145 [Solirubrobacteraceae bacterium]
MAAGDTARLYHELSSHSPDQAFPTFSEIYVAALKALHGEMTTAPQPVGPSASRDD